MPDSLCISSDAAFGLCVCGFGVGSGAANCKLNVQLFECKLYKLSKPCTGFCWSRRGRRSSVPKQSHPTLSRGSPENQLYVPLLCDAYIIIDIRLPCLVAAKAKKLRQQQYQQHRQQHRQQQPASISGVRVRVSHMQINSTQKDFK